MAADQGEVALSRSPVRVEPVGGASCAAVQAVVRSEIPLHLRTFAIGVPLAILVAACATPATAPSPAAVPSSSAHHSMASPVVTPSTEIEITMTDGMRFEPAAIIVKRGESITFVVKNVGVIVHEFFVGSEAQQVDHAAEMAMTEGSHDHRNGVGVDPGETRSLTMTFPEAGSQLIGCHEKGHYDAGMSGTLTVVD